MAVERLPGAIGVMFGIQMQHDACDVAPKATVRRCPRYFRFTPESRHSSQGLACLKGAKSRHSRPLVLDKPGPESASAIRHCILSGQIACVRTTKKHGHCAKLGTLLKPSPLWSTSRATTWPRGRPETLSIFRDSIGLPCPAGPARNGARPPESCRIVCLLRPAPPAPDLRCS